MGIISWLIIGGFAGWIASKIMGADKDMGLMANIIVGIVGAFIGGFVFSFFGKTGITGFNFYSFFVAIVGATLLLFIVKAIKK
jgi:uncharacterized membrane protein YeaQ/YmgE (transglycosylase-associated protein family)